MSAHLLAIHVDQRAALHLLHSSHKEKRLQDCAFYPQNPDYIQIILQYHHILVFLRPKIDPFVVQSFISN